MSFVCMGRRQKGSRNDMDPACIIRSSKRNKEKQKKSTGGEMKGSRKE